MDELGQVDVDAGQPNDVPPPQLYYPTLEDLVRIPRRQARAACVLRNVAPMACSSRPTLQVLPQFRATAGTRQTPEQGAALLALVTTGHVEGRSIQRVRRT